MKNVNKSFVINYVTKLLLKELLNKNEIDYNIIKEAIFDSKEIYTYLLKRKNKYIYIDTLLKRDDRLKCNLQSHDIFYYKNKFIIGKQESNVPKSENFAGVDFSKYYYPYEILITKYKTPKKLKYTKTNERVLNHNLRANLDLKKIITALDNDLINITIALDDDLKIYYDYEILFSIMLNSYSYYTNKKFKKYINDICGIYPFNYFNYNNILIASYILIKIDKLEEAKYITILLLDNLIKNLIVKYFTNYKMINGKIFDTFFVEEINSMKLADYNLINDYFLISTKNFDFVSFYIGLYKLIIYLKNKYNRELRNISIELYSKSRILSDVINIDDSTAFTNYSISKLCH
jgi:hypothetical protein